jgi:hypothetical protein
VSGTILVVLAGLLCFFPPAALAAPPPNDAFDAAQPVSPPSGAPATASGTNVEGGREAGEPSHAGSSGRRSVWFTWTADASRRVSIDTCGSSFDTLLGVYRGSDPAALQFVASNDDGAGCGDGSAVVFAAAAGESYRIVVDGWQGQTGSVALSVAAAPAPAPPPAPPPTPAPPPSTPPTPRPPSTPPTQPTQPTPPAPPLPTVEASDVTVEEPDGEPATGTFTVSLSFAPTLPVSVAYETSQVSAQQKDFTGASGRLTFAPGETAQQVGVTVKPDDASEPAEQLSLDLRQPVNARLGRSFGILTIVDDDLPLPGKCGPAFCMEPGLGPVRMSNTGRSAELVKTIPITRGGDKRVVMNLGPKQIGRMGAGDRLEASAEVEVSVTCLEQMKKCVGTRYRYSPKVTGSLVLSRKQGGTKGIPVSKAKRLHCSQSLPNRNHHCVLVFPPVRTPLPRGCGSCHLNLVLSAAHPTARRGNKLVIGSDAASGVQQDRGRINAVVISPGAEEPRLAVERRPQRRSLPVASRSDHGLPQRVVYSVRLDDLREHEQLSVDARALVRTSHLPYGTFIGSHVVLSGRPGAVGRASRRGGGPEIGSPITEKNGFNCTRGRSAHDNPCEVRKVGLLRVKRTIRGPAYVNLVLQAAARFGGRWHKGDTGRVLGRGALRVRRYSPMGWLELTPLP